MCLSILGTRSDREPATEPYSELQRYWYRPAESHWLGTRGLGMWQGPRGLHIMLLC